MVDEVRRGTARSFGFLRRDDVDKTMTARIGTGVEIWESPQGDLYAWPAGTGRNAKLERRSHGAGVLRRYDYFPQGDPGLV